MSTEQELRTGESAVLKASIMQRCRLAQKSGGGASYCGALLSALGSDAGSTASADGDRRMLSDPASQSAALSGLPPSFSGG